MVDPTISLLLRRLVPVIERRVRDEVCLLLNSREEARKLASKLRTIQELLDNAEKRKFTERGVKEWLEKLKDAAYDMDDALDEWEMKNRELEIEGSQQHDDVSESFREKVSSFIQSLCSSFEHSIERRRIALKFKKLNGTLELIAKENEDNFRFLPNLPVDSQEFELDRDTTSFDEASYLTGRVDEREELVSKLLSEGSQQGNGIPIIAIVGTGGLGKTTLARLASKDLEKHFSVRPWISVSKPFDKIKIAQAILKSLSPNSPNVTEFQTLLELINKSISGKKFLLVLDDIWTEDKNKWIPLKASLSNGAPGSRILVTTRNQRVAEMMGAQIQPLHPLSDTDCWSLMCKIAFQGGDNRNRETLEGIVREIARKCEGLPLAAVTLGSLLLKRRNRPIGAVTAWTDVLNSEVWELEIAGEQIFPLLYLSYNELHPAVKRCFSYCALFSKKSKIEVNTLIRMWMAQGFLSSGSEDEMEQNGRDYVQDLAERSLFQNIKKDDNGHIVSCEMHDIIHEFAQFLTNGECVIVKPVDDTAITATGASCTNARHLAYRGNRYDTSRSQHLNCNFEKLRSFVSNDYLPLNGLRTLRCVRVLDLSGCGLEELPDMENLIHLRYLDLTMNCMSELPRSLCHLYNLQTLILEGCFGLSELPEEIYNLKNLRHLHVNMDVVILPLPQGVEKLTCLRTLNCFKARGGSKLGYLRNLNQLEGDLHIVIVNLNEESDVIEAQNAQLKNKVRLGTLKLDFLGTVRTEVMDALVPPPNLSRLVLDGLGNHFPTWLSTSLDNLKALEISRSSSLLPFPLWNLQFLENLSIGYMHMEHLGHEFLGITDDGIGRATAFPKLKWLKFNHCSDWTEWEDIGEYAAVSSIMPCLTRLEVPRCPKLNSLPRRLLRRTSLEYLNISGSDLLTTQYESGILGHDEFLSTTCLVVTDD